MYEREFPATAVATVMLIASGATQILAAANPKRAQLSLQGADNFFFSPLPSVTASAAIPTLAGLFGPSGAIIAEAYHTGAVYANSGAANGATIAIRVWESSFAGA